VTDVAVNPVRCGAAPTVMMLTPPASSHMASRYMVPVAPEFGTTASQVPLSRGKMSIAFVMPRTGADGRNERKQSFHICIQDSRSGRSSRKPLHTRNAFQPTPPHPTRRLSLSPPHPYARLRGLEAPSGPIALLSVRRPGAVPDLSTSPRMAGRTQDAPAADAKPVRDIGLDGTFRPLRSPQERCLHRE